MASLRRNIIALFAFVWLFSTMCFQMCRQMVCTSGCIVTLIASFQFTERTVFFLGISTFASHLLKSSSMLLFVDQGLITDKTFNFRRKKFFLMQGNSKGLKRIKNLYFYDKTPSKRSAFSHYNCLQITVHCSSGENFWKKTAAERLFLLKQKT